MLTVPARLLNRDRSDCVAQRFHEDVLETFREVSCGRSRGRLKAQCLLERFEQKLFSVLVLKIFRELYWEIHGLPRAEPLVIRLYSVVVGERLFSMNELQNNSDSPNVAFIGVSPAIVVADELGRPISWAIVR